VKVTDIIPILKLAEKYSLSAMGIAVIILSARLYRSGFYKPSTVFICIAGINAFLWKFVFLTYGESELTEILSEIFEVLFGVFTALGVLAYVSSIYTEYSKALQRSEEHFRSLIENAQDTITIVNGDGTIRYASPSVEQVLGYKPEESIGKNIAEFIHPEDASDVSTVITYAGQNPGNTLSAEYRVKHKDNSWRIFEGKGKSFLDEAGVTGVVINARDITERKLADKAVRESEERYRSLVEGVRDVIFTLSTDGRITSLNPVFETITGWSRNDWVGKPFAPIINPDDLPVAMEIFQRVLQGELSKIYELRILSKSGEYLIGEFATTPIIKDEKVIGVLGIARDITERKQKEEALKKLSTAVQQTADSVIIVNKDDLIEYVNPAFEKLTGYTSEEAVGKTPGILKSGEHDKKFYKKLHETIHAGRVFRAEIINKKKNGEIYLVASTITPIIDTQGSITHFVSTEKDITEDKKAEELRLENERLAYASKSKSDFLATMSHELRTPLNSIIGFSELLKQKIFGELNEKQERHVDNILISGKFLLSLIDDILDLTKIEVGKMDLVIEMFEISNAINEVSTLIKEESKKNNIVFKKELDPQLDFIEADKRKFKQILFNLLDNAIKFSKPEGGTVTITAKKEGDMVRFSISDTGIGIKEEDMSKLFKKFQQIDSGITRKYGGPGLGLVISKELVELLGGKITVKSKYGEGSTFTFSMPIVAKRAGEIK